MPFAIACRMAAQGTHTHSADVATFEAQEHYTVECPLTSACKMQLLFLHFIVSRQITPMLWTMQGSSGAHHRSVTHYRRPSRGCGCPQPRSGACPAAAPAPSPSTAACQAAPAPEESLHGSAQLVRPTGSWCFRPALAQQQPRDEGMSHSSMSGCTSSKGELARHAGS